MCLGIPGRITAHDGGDLATAEVIGASRSVNVALLHEDGVAVGDWVLIHMGFAMEIIDEAEAATALEGLQLMGQGEISGPLGEEAAEPSDAPAGAPDDSR